MLSWNQLNFEGSVGINMHQHQSLRAWGRKGTQSWIAEAGLLCPFILKLCSTSTQCTPPPPRQWLEFHIFPEGLSFWSDAQASNCFRLCLPFTLLPSIWSSLCVLSRTLSLKCFFLYHLCFSFPGRNLWRTGSVWFSQPRSSPCPLTVWKKNSSWGILYFLSPIAMYPVLSLKEALIYFFSFRILSSFFSPLYCFPKRHVDF